MTSDNMLLVVAVITLVLNFLGITSKYKILLLFAVGGYIAMIVEFQAYPSMVIVFIGLIIFNLWYATIGSRLESR